MNPERNRDLDQRLESPAQRAVRDAVRQLPDEELSMAWRSSLNERLRAESAVQKRATRRWHLALRPALGLGMACALAAVVTFRLGSGPTSTPTPAVLDSELEAALFSAHRQVVGHADVAGTGLLPSEVNYVRREEAPLPSEWSEPEVVDLESL